MKMINDIKEFLRGEHFRVGLAIIKMGARSLPLRCHCSCLGGSSHLRTRHPQGDSRLYPPEPFGGYEGHLLRYCRHRCRHYPRRPANMAGGALRLVEV